LITAFIKYHNYF